MEAKKSRKAAIESQRGSWLLMGVIVALSFMFVSFEWTQRDVKATTMLSADDEPIFVTELVPITFPEEKLLSHDFAEGALAGCGDSAASSFGAGVIRPGMIYDVAGTASIFSVSTCQFNPDEEHKTILAARSVVDRLYIPHAYFIGSVLHPSFLRKNLSE